MKILFLLASASALSTLAQAQEGAAIFAGADEALGAKLILEHRCTECHASKFGGDGLSVYRPMERIKTAGSLRGMVEQCNSGLGLGLFPEEVTAISAVLNKRHYGFK